MDVIKDLTISDVDPNETDEELWTWVRDEVLLKSGIPVSPWTQYTLERHGTEATFQLNIPLVQHVTPSRAN